MNQTVKSQHGFALVESLVAIALLGITIVGITRLFTTCFLTHAATQHYAAVENDMQAIIDTYRTTSYTALLGKFGINPLAIQNGQQVTETTTGTFAKATYATVLTALKSTIGATPEAVRISVTATQRRGVLGDTQFTFETVMAPIQ
jgi:prepilin-type N-terminal cleavage/methylation domain-containing protein